MKRHVRGWAGSCALVIALAVAGPALAQKSGGDSQDFVFRQPGEPVAA